MGLNIIKKHSLLWAVILIAFLGQSLIPAGFMPGQKTSSSDHDRFSLVICSGLSTKTITLDQDGQPLTDPHHDSKAKDNSVCPYATIAGKAIVPAVNSQTLPVEIALLAPAFWPETLLTQTTTHLPEARGPPRLS